MPRSRLHVLPPVTLCSAGIPVGHTAAQEGRRRRVGDSSVFRYVLGMHQSRLAEAGLTGVEAVETVVLSDLARERREISRDDQPGKSTRSSVRVPHVHLNKRRR